MNRLQVLISNEIRADRSYRDMEKVIGINHVSMSDYHQKGVIPNGKNLAKLERYFKVPLEDLVEPVVVAASPSQRDTGLEEQSYAIRRVAEIMRPLSEEKQLILLAKVLQSKEEGLL